MVVHLYKCNNGITVYDNTNLYMVNNKYTKYIPRGIWIGPGTNNYKSKKDGQFIDQKNKILTKKRRRYTKGTLRHMSKKN